MCCTPNASRPRPPTAPRAALKRALGLDSFSVDIFASDPSELELQSYLAARAAADSGANQAMTAAEVLKREERYAEVDSGGKRSGVHAVAFAPTDDAKAALEKCEAGGAVVLAVDTKHERIVLQGAGSHGSLSAVAADVGSRPDAAAFVFYRWQHAKHADGEVAVLISFTPDSAPVKTKMLMATVKPAVVAAGAVNAKLATLARSFEVQEANEIDEEQFLAELYPEAKPVVAKAAFKKPSRPGRGGRRLNK